MSKESFIEKVRQLVLDKKLTHIADARDESARGKIRVVVELKKDAYPKKILNQLYKMTDLQTTFHYNVLALVNGIQPRIMGLKEILAEFIKHRQKVIRRRTEYDLRKAKERAHILEGLKIALDNIDEVINLIGNPKGEFIIMIDGKIVDKKEIFKNMTLEEHYKYYEDQGVDKKEIIKKIASCFLANNLIIRDIKF